MKQLIKNRNESGIFIIILSKAFCVSSSEGGQWGSTLYVASTQINGGFDFAIKKNNNNQ
jgi:hypothetical protein